MVCPKCQRERRPGEDACARCGLLVTRWEGFSEDVAKLEPVDAAWEALKREWHDEDAHRRFLDLSAQVSGLDVAAAHYRRAARERPDDPRPEMMLKRAFMLAQNLYAARAQAERTQLPSGWVRALGFVGAAIVVFAGLMLAFGLMRRC